MSEATAQSLDLQLRQYRTLLDLSKAIASHRNLSDLFHELAERLHELFDFHNLSLVLHDGAQNLMRIHVLETSEPVMRQLPREIPVEGSAVGWVWQNQTPFVTGDVDKENRFPVTKVLRDYPVKSLCILPLTTARQHLGVLGIASDKRDAYTNLDFEFAQLVAAQIAVAVENALAFREIDALKNRLEEEKLYLEETIQTEYDFEEIIGSSRVLRRVLQEVETVAKTDSTVLIYGETGTGKELLARAIHNLSPRRARTLVKVNCAAIPTGLLESELFGHERGAFTGAIERRIGRFELAHEGTIFLDEVGDVPLELQSKLLRVLQEQEFERLGSSRTIRVNVRVVAATNIDLAEMVAEKKFRNDLYYRLNVFPITLPPLRERPDDIVLLVHFFAHKFAQQMKKPIDRIPSQMLAALAAYSWPGNIRELQNLIERAVILSRGSTLEIPLAELKQSAKAAPDQTDTITLDAVEREHILRVLRESNWVIGGRAGAAARLGLPRTTLNNKMRKLGITRPRS